MSWKSTTTPEKLTEQLAKFGVTVTFRKNMMGRTFGVTFIDNRLRAVFKGSDLGKEYSAGAILETLAVKNETIKPFVPFVSHDTEAMTGNSVVDLLLNIATAEHEFTQWPLSARPVRKKKRRKGRS